MIFSVITNLNRNLSSKIIHLRENSTVPPPKEPIVTLLNAATGVGKNVALLLKQSPYIGELRLYDANKTIRGIAEDLSHIDTKAQIKSFSGQMVLKDAITDANIVVIVGGDRESSKETLNDTFDKNVDDVRISALNMTEFNPNAIFCIAKPPVEALVPLVSEEYKKAGVYDWTKIFGIKNSVSMIANSIIAAKDKQKPIDVICPIVGGLSNECLVAILSQVRPKTKTTLSSDVQKQIVGTENEILKLHENCKGMYLIPALGIYRFINSLIKAYNGDTNCVECAFVRQTGHIGNFLPYMTSIIKFGKHGISSTHMPKMNGEEGHALQKAAVSIKKCIRLGESFVTGEPQTIYGTTVDRKKEISAQKYIDKQTELNLIKTT
ncbi:malate dehydrogenase, mitochondrial-like [Diorhabda sublineata]|uniref:malate dehydrogenase, mitochondrial-like n=1 Tax=Diorhabda sublineata TaxID=1163346 RepID=UPI0024E18C35|nr:malate dehydrogenase, mitochondrial-like [Diorhabda sublineata]